MRTLTLLVILLAGTLARADEPNAAEPMAEAGQRGSIRLGAGFHTDIGPYFEVSFEDHVRGLRTGNVPIPLTILVQPRTATCLGVTHWMLHRREEVEATQPQT